MILLLFSILFCKCSIVDSPCTAVFSSSSSLVLGSATLVCPEHCHPYYPLQHILLIPTIIRVGAVLPLLKVSDETDKVPEVIGAKLGKQHISLLELGVDQVGLYV